MPTYLEPVKGNRDGFEQILNWIGSLKVKGEDVEPLEQDLLQLERFVQDFNSEMVTEVVNKRLLNWLEIIRQPDNSVFIDSEKTEFTLDKLHTNIHAILYIARQLSVALERDSASKHICNAIQGLEPHISFQEGKPIAGIVAQANIVFGEIIKSGGIINQAAFNHNLSSELFEEGKLEFEKAVWMVHEFFPEHQYQWEVFIKFSGKHHRSVTVSKILWLLSEALESISGVVVEIEDQGVGSIWYKLRIFFKDLLAKEETLDTLEKVRDAAIAEADKRIEGVRNLEAQTLKTQAEAATIEKQSELIPDSEEAKKIRDLDIKKKELEIREKEADIKKKELENYKATLDLVQQTAYMMKEGMLQAAPVEIQINGQPYLSCQDGQFLPGVEMKAIDEKTLVKPENEELQ
jgi:hypothetical protein